MNRRHTRPQLDSGPQFAAPRTGTMTFDPPQPCCTLAAIGRRCGNPATVGAYWTNGDGSMYVQPVCKVCAEAWAKVDGVLEEPKACG